MTANEHDSTSDTRKNIIRELYDQLTREQIDKNETKDSRVSEANRGYLMGARSHRRGGNKPAQNAAYQVLAPAWPKKIGQPTRKYPPKDARKNEHKFFNTTNSLWSFQ